MAENTAAQPEPGNAGNPEALSFEQARDELAEVVAKLESSGNSLEESLALWERGELLVTTCQRWLDDAKARIEKVRAADPK